MTKTRVILNAAITLEGSMLAPGGALISNDEDLWRVHLQRELADGVVVGAGTWNHDLPRLNVRADHLGRTARRQPRAVVLGGNAPLQPRPAAHQLPGPLVIGPKATPDFEHVFVASRDLSGSLVALREKGLNRLFVEGGPTVLNSFVAQRLWDEFYVFVDTIDLRRARAAAAVAFDLTSAHELRHAAFGEGTVLTFGPRGRVCTAKYEVPVCEGRTIHHFVHDPQTGESVTVVEYGNALKSDKPLVRVHSMCFAGEVAESELCDCGPQLAEAVARFRANGGGLLVYCHAHEGRGIGLLAKSQAYELKALGLDTVEASIAVGAPADARRYELAAAALHTLGVRSIQLMCNNPMKTAGLTNRGISVFPIPFQTKVSEACWKYLNDKVHRMNHDPILVRSNTSNCLQETL